jgi:hypothetical protein
MRIGFDLDNTLICYDDAFHAAGVERGIFSASDVVANKTMIGDYLRSFGEGGVEQWQALQGYVYGPGIHLAQLFADVVTCIATLEQQGHELCIISHKTKYGHFDNSGLNLHDAARNFLHEQSVTRYIPLEQIFFCPTLDAKIACIQDQRCDIFVDDLTDVLEHRSFPATTRGILFRSPQTFAGFQASSWLDILAAIAVWQAIE